MVFCGLPPWGGSGLKSVAAANDFANKLSPSLGREWIEITPVTSLEKPDDVSLLGEGVD